MAMVAVRQFLISWFLLRVAARDGQGDQEEAKLPHDLSKPISKLVKHPPDPLVPLDIPGSPLSRNQLRSSHIATELRATHFAYEGPYWPLMVSLILAAIAKMAKWKPIKLSVPLSLEI